MQIKAILFTLLTIPTTLCAVIITSDRFDSILPYLENIVPEETVVVSDIDNTLVESKTQLGSAAWGRYVIEQFKQRNVPQKEAEEIEEILWGVVQKQIEVQPVDATCPEVISYIQSHHVLVLGLTARRPSEAEHTYKQLQFIGVHLGQENAPSHKFSLTHAALYDQGVLFCSPHNKKSAVLCKYFEENNMHPKLVIFIDDTKTHIHDVEQTLSQKGITCIGILFTGADSHKKAFNAKIAELQWKIFPHLISDRAAKLILEE